MDAKLIENIIFVKVLGEILSPNVFNNHLYTNKSFSL